MKDWDFLLGLVKAMAIKYKHILLDFFSFLSPSDDHR